MIRRELFKFAGGAATGLAFTPLPWRLLGDSAIWTQNWSWTPPTPRGEVAETESRCTLCPAGCAVKLRTCGGTPTGVWPRGEAMCPAGLAGHTLPWHPLRLRQCLHRGRPSHADRALDAARAAMDGGFAVLDLLPGRTASLLHRMHLAAVPNARYIAAPMPEGGTAQAMAALLSTPSGLAIELSRAKTALSISTPLLDGWAAPRLTGPDRGFKLLHVDTWHSRTADLADLRFIVHPGSETALLLGLGRILLQSPSFQRRVGSLPGFTQYQAAIANCSPAETAARTGLSEQRLAELAAALQENGPAVVIADGDPLGGPLPADTRIAAAALNAMLGAEAFTQRGLPPVPPAWKGVQPTPLDEVPNRSIGLLLIDEPAPGLALPWSAISPKLKPQGALVIALTWNRSTYSQRAQWLVPVPVYLEQAMDAPPAHDTGVARLALSPALLPPPAESIAAADFVARLAGAEPDLAARLDERAKLAGAADTPAAPAPPLARLLPAGLDPARLAAAAAATLQGPQFAAHGWRLASVSPLLGKLWQEWDLRPAPGQAGGHPDSLRALGWHSGPLARIESEAGQLPIRLETDLAAPQGVVPLNTGPAYAQICATSPDGAWRLTNPKVVRA